MKACAPAQALLECPGTKKKRRDPPLLNCIKDDHAPTSFLAVSAAEAASVEYASAPISAQNS